MLSLRRVTPADVRALVGADMPEAWCVGSPGGYAAERDGVVVAIGAVTWDRWGRAWGWFSKRESVPVATMHRCAIEMLDMLRKADEPALYAFCNVTVPGAAKWLRRLGFVEDGTLQHELGPVYRCDLNMRFYK